MTSAPTTLVKSATFAALLPVWPAELQARVQAAARRLGRLVGRELPRRGGWREMLARRATSSKRGAAVEDQERNAHR